MPIGKKIYKTLSKRHGARKLRQQNEAKPPAKVEQWKKNKVARAASLNVNIVDLAGPRKISPNEGLPAVNGKSGQEVKEKLVHKPKLKNPLPDFTAGAIEPIQSKAAPQRGKKQSRKCSNCGEPGHTKRKCQA